MTQNTVKPGGTQTSEKPSGACPPGQRDYSAARLSRHAIDRFLERFWTGVVDDRTGAEAALRQALQRTRRLGRNPENGASAVLAVYAEREMVGIFQDESCTTVLTWPQFEPRLREFGRPNMPRKRGRMLRRLGRGGGSSVAGTEPPAP